MSAPSFGTKKRGERRHARVLQPPLISVVTSPGDRKRGGGRLARIFEGKLNIVSKRSDGMSSLPLSASLLSSDPLRTGR